MASILYEYVYWKKCKVEARKFVFLQIKLVNINATDIADGRPSIVLGLMWTIILYFQVTPVIHNISSLYCENVSLFIHTPLLMPFAD